MYNALLLNNYIFKKLIHFKCININKNDLYQFLTSMVFKMINYFMLCKIILFKKV